MKLPEDLYFTKEHVWLKHIENDIWQTGITDYAQEMLGDIVFVDAPHVGKDIVEEQPCGIIESVKTGADLHAPWDGQVTEINEALANNPELINDHPYKTWIYAFRAAKPVDQAALLTADQYQALLKA